MTPREKAVINERYLKIGNRVEYNSYTMSVFSIMGAVPRKDTRYDGKVILDLFDGAGLITATIDEVNPIVLTADLLLKTGANRIYKNVFTYSRFELIWRKDYKYWYVTETGDNGYISKVEYVHEWQNIIDALDQTELYEK